MIRDDNALGDVPTVKCENTGNEDSLVEADLTGRGSADFFQIRVPEDEFGEIVFVEMEDERVPDVQEEAVNLNVLTHTGTRRSIRGLSESFRSPRPLTANALRSAEPSRPLPSREVISLNIDTSDSVI